MTTDKSPSAARESTAGTGVESAGTKRSDAPTGVSADPAKESYIVNAALSFFRSARKATPYVQIAGRLFPSHYGNWRFVDSWVLGHLLLAAVVWAVTGLVGTHWLCAVALLYGAVRVYEMSITAAAVMLGGRPDAQFTVLSIRRSLILGVLNYVEVMFWFAAAYAFFASHFGQNVALVATVTGSFYYSILTMTTYGDLSPQTTFGRWLVIVHLLLSIFLTIGVLGRLVSALPRPKPRVGGEE